MLASLANPLMPVNPTFVSQKRVPKCLNASSGANATIANGTVRKKIRKNMKIHQKRKKKEKKSIQ